MPTHLTEDDKGVAEGGKLEELSWATNSDSYISRNLGATYSTYASFEYRGSDIVGAIESIYVIAGASSGSPAHSVRIYDATNAQVIAEITGATTVAQALESLGAIANLPTGAAIFDIQAKRDAAGAVQFQLSALTIKYE